MVDLIIEKMHDIRLMTMLFAAIAASATVFTLISPLFASDGLARRMKSVADERERIRQRERDRMRSEKISLRQSPNMAPFLYALGLVFLGYTGLAISVWPNIIPPGISIWDAAAPPQSQGFALVGALFIIPFILMYTVWAYYVFRGKVRHGEGYH